ncbi:hypothetical protein ABZ816_42050 [Actinosynnema sp. NPDC047251]|uniref:Putative secreted protein n=1 Tax=Saccharothrix espanaensis (strain ATCC 51144 / DSM 44229 / JCM 9112 / NBRC 15066 / NRRL 15764) TaxID=1179773 RepID=K0K2X3_SACES|nr:hypothetical protein [Saccharothrix espanaensis]CCH31942.1 putative secreted protein [Saccharothrix espanaensis DSM 44229]
MTQHGTGSTRRPAVAWLPYLLLAALLSTWVVLAATLPVAGNRQLTIDVSCTSGNPPVGVWVESASGGSWWAEEGRPGPAAATRFTFQQAFTGEYRVDVGCGGTAEHWGVAATSAGGSAPYRRLVCDDENLAGTATGGCRDRP